MRRAVSVLVLAGSLLALACGHEATAPSAVREVPPPVTTTSDGATTSDGMTRGVTEQQPPAREELATGERCVEVDSELGGKHVTLEGRILVDEAFEHPARGKTHPYILHLDTPRCAIGTDEPRVAELHLTSSEGIPLKALVGAHVRVSGDPFAAHTAWHARPIVLMATTATTIPR
jgi:hypothetical protein